MKFFPFLILFMSCSPQMIKATMDFIQGEVQVVEEVTQDLANEEHKRPSVEFTVAKF